VDRRTLIAFTLIILIFLLYPVYVRWITGGSTYQESQAPTSSAKDTAVKDKPPAEELAAKVQSTEEEREPALEIEPAPGGEEKLIRVETPLYSAVLTSAGGNLVTWKLKRYSMDDEGPVSLIREGKPGFFNLVVQSGRRKTDLGRYNFRVIGDDLELNDKTEQGTLRFELEVAGDGRLVKEYTFYHDRYDIKLKLDLDGLFDWKKEPVDLRLVLGPGLNVTEKNRKNDLKEFRALTYMGGRVVQVRLKSVKQDKKISNTGDIKWAGLRTKYFMAAVIPEGGLFSETESRGGGEALEIAAERRCDTGKMSFTAFIGPMDYDLLKSYGVGLENAVYMGWSLVKPISRVILRFLKATHRVIPNYGIVIIIFSILIKILFYPLSMKSMSSMRKMQALQPKVAELKEKYKNDPQQLNKAMMRLYKEEGVNPLGGCLPLILQLPVFISLYAVLYHTIEMRDAGFVLWISDLSQKDPYYVLPILMGITMFVQQKMTTASDPRQAAMTYLMPIIFTWFFLGFPSGLVLYWLVNNLLQVIQQWLTRPRAATVQEA